MALVISLSFSFLAVLCAERVGQMTKTYNDIDAVTRLLEEVSVSGEGEESPVSDRWRFLWIEACITVCLREESQKSGPLGASVSGFVL